MNEEVVARSLNEFDSFLGKAIAPGSFLAVSDVRRRALLQNPFREETDTICQWVGFADGKPAGFNYSFPVRVWADGKSYHGTTGSSLNVETWARKTNLGIILPAKGVETTSRDGIAIAASCSQMAIPIHRINGYRYFFYPRYIALWRSRCVLEMFLPNMMVRVGRLAFDLVIRCYVGILRLLLKFLLRGYLLERVKPEDEVACEKMAKILSDDRRRFREDHDARWFKWHLNNAFSVDGPCQGWLMIHKGSGAAVGFGLVKRRFYPQASHRGFKNVWLGSIVEWGVSRNYSRMEKALVLALALKTAENCDGCDFSVSELHLGSFARRLGWQHVGDANVGIKVMKKFPYFDDDSIRDISNWRIRPAMGDNGLS